MFALLGSPVSSAEARFIVKEPGRSSGSRQVRGLDDVCAVATAVRRCKDGVTEAF